MWECAMLKSNLHQCLSVAQIDFDASPQEIDSADDETYAKTIFPAFPNMSIDYGILEKSADVHSTEM